MEARLITLIVKQDRAPLTYVASRQYPQGSIREKKK